MSIAGDYRHPFRISPIPLRISNDAFDVWLAIPCAKMARAYLKAARATLRAGVALPAPPVYTAASFGISEVAFQRLSLLMAVPDTAAARKYLRRARLGGTPNLPRMYQ